MNGNDITMCVSKNCPLEHLCYRHNLKFRDPYWQSCCDFLSLRRGNICEHYVAMCEPTKVVDNGKE